VLRVARTIADLLGLGEVDDAAVTRALGFRPKPEHVEVAA
jgi:predicted ATPase with chaperone activity